MSRDLVVALVLIEISQFQSFQIEIKTLAGK